MARRWQQTQERSQMRKVVVGIAVRLAVGIGAASAITAQTTTNDHPMKTEPVVQTPTPAAGCDTTCRTDCTSTCLNCQKACPNPGSTDGCNRGCWSSKQSCMRSCGCEPGGGMSCM